MADWPRTIKPRTMTLPRFPSAASSWGHSGKGQFRDLIAAGRMWEEVYPILEYDHEDVREFIANVNNYLRTGTSFDIEHYMLNTPNGAGGGTPLVKGAAETGISIDTDGWPVSTLVLKAGDIIDIAGVPYVLDVLADVTSDGAGNATITINPPIWTAPADNAAITVTGVKFKCVLLAADMPVGGPGKFIGNARLVFRETLE